MTIQLNLDISETAVKKLRKLFKDRTFIPTEEPGRADYILLSTLCHTGVIELFVLDWGCQESEFRLTELGKQLLSKI